MRMNRCNSGTDSKGGLAGFSSLDGRRTVIAVCAGSLCGRTVRYVMKALQIVFAGLDLWMEAHLARAVYCVMDVYCGAPGTGSVLRHGCALRRTGHGQCTAS